MSYLHFSISFVMFLEKMRSHTRLRTLLWSLLDTYNTLQACTMTPGTVHRVGTKTANMCILKNYILHFVHTKLTLTVMD